MPVTESTTTISTTSGDGSCCCSGSGTVSPCCLGPVPPEVTFEVTSVGTAGCECVGTHVLPYVGNGSYLLEGVAGCDHTINIGFGCAFDGEFYYWAAGITCNFAFGPIVSFLSDPMLEPPDCCPIDLSFGPVRAPDTIGACCGGTLPYDISVRITAPCPNTGRALSSGSVGSGSGNVAESGSGFGLTTGSEGSGTGVVEEEDFGTGFGLTTGTEGIGDGLVETPVDCSAIPCLSPDDIAWSDYILLVRGIEDGVVEVCHCDELNGTWDLSFTGTEWDTADCDTLPNGCRCAVPFGPVWKLICLASVWTVIDYVSGVSYVADTFTPFTGGTFTKTGTEMFCAEMPATLTLTIAGHPILCV